MPAPLVAALFALAGAVAQAQDGPAAGPETFLVRVLDAASGDPLEGARIEYRRQDGGGAKSVKVEAVTGKDGEARIGPRPTDATAYVSLTVRKPGHVPMHVGRGSSQGPLDFPESKEFRLERGRPLAGVVVDEAGTPVEGATVELSIPTMAETYRSVYFSLAKPRTDGQGRWRVEEAPADRASLSGRVVHPDYRPASMEFGAEGAESRTVLTRGAAVAGRVKGPEGRPVAGARILLLKEVYDSHLPEATTDAEGAFTLKNAAAGPSAVLVTAPGFAPGLRDVRVEADGPTPTVEVALEPGSKLRLKVVDRDGKPVAGVGFGVETWRGRQSFSLGRGRTDAEGLATWADAPRDEVRMSFYREGWMSSRDVPMRASDEVREVVLSPELEVSGAVTDAKTGEPVPKFRVVRGLYFSGKDEASWMRGEASAAEDGRYRERFTEPYDGWAVRIEAPGYKPADSRRFRSDEGRATQDFALEPEAGLAGTVLRPDGAPAAGAEVALATSGVFVALESGKFGRAYNAPLATADAEGRFWFPTPEGPYRLVAVGDAGFAEASPEDFAKSPTLRLAPWARIEGEVRLGKNPGGGETVTFDPDRPTGPARTPPQLMLSLGVETKADAEGRFVMERVVPRPGRVGRVLVSELGGGATSHMPTGMTAVEVRPGETARVVVGGKGRPVVGRVAVDGVPGGPIDWSRNQPVRITSEPGFLGRLLGGAAARQETYGGGFDRDGTFRAEDVPPGSYNLSVALDAPVEPGRPGIREQLGGATRSITVPEGDQGEPVDVGEVTITLRHLLKVGDEAPALDLERLDGPQGRFALADRRGKVVVLDFWATWCGPCRAEMPSLKKLQEEFGGHPRFELVGVSCDNAGAPAAKFAVDEGLAWTQAFAGPMGGGAAEAYGVQGIPSTFVIGPDGRIVAKDLRGEALRDAVRQAIGTLGE